MEGGRKEGHEKPTSRDVRWGIDWDHILNLIVSVVWLKMVWKNKNEYIHFQNVNG